MTEATVALIEYLHNMGLDKDVDLLREIVRVVSEALMELEVEHTTGAAKYERSEQRTNQRNGYRERVWQTRVGEVALRIPKLRKGTYFPSLLEPRRPAEKALLAVVQARAGTVKAYIEGVSTRKVDDLLQALGLTGIDKSRVSRICRELDGPIAAFRNRPLEASCPYLWLDATYMKVREC